MSDERDQTALESKAEDRAAEAAEDEDDDDEAESPFDHPAFLPVILWALSIWFGYDGWINQDPDMLEHQTFNRVGFGLLVVAGIYFTIQAVKEMREDAERPGE